MFGKFCTATKIVIVGILICVSAILIVPQHGGIRACWQQAVQTPVAFDPLKQELDKLASLPPQEHLWGWLDLGGQILEAMVLPYAGQGAGEPPMMASLAAIVERYGMSVMESVAYSVDPTTFSPYQRYLFTEWVAQVQPQAANSNVSTKLLDLQQEALRLPAVAFKQVAGQGKLESVEPTLMTLNACFMPGGLSYLYGGVRPWQGRFDQLIEIINENNPAILCLQEVHSPQSAEALFAGLSEQYSHLFGRIGDRVFGLRLEEIAMNSGLFVATNLPVRNPYFEPFQVPGGQHQVNKGFFYVEVEIAPSQWIGLINCHLEPFNTAQGRQVRLQELGRIIHFAQNSGLACIICGDLNIPWGSYEPAQYLIEEECLHPTTHVVDYTYTDFFERWLHTPASLDQTVYDTLDYILVTPESSHVQLEQIRRIDCFDTHQPDEAISDHHGLFGKLVVSAQP